MLNQLLDALQIISGRRTSLIDLQDHVIMSSTELCDFCKIIHAQDCGHNYCPQSDMEAINIVKKTGEVYIYRCHAGLCEAIIPIMAGQKMIAALMLGQCLDDSPLEEQWKLVERSCRGRFDLERLREAFYRLPQFSNRTMQAYARILTAFASYISLKNLVGEQEHSEARLLSDYIDQHLYEELSLRLISLELGISRTNLCKIAKEQLHGTIFQIIKKRRMAAAESLLANTDLPIAQIAEKVGYSDGNYFSRIFTSTYGCSPSQYRKKFSVVSLENVESGEQAILPNKDDFSGGKR